MCKEPSRLGHSILSADFEKRKTQNFVASNLDENRYFITTFPAYREQ